MKIFIVCSQSDEVTRIVTAFQSNEQAYQFCTDAAKAASRLKHGQVGTKFDEYATNYYSDHTTYYIVDIKLK